MNHGIEPPPEDLPDVTATNTVETLGYDDPYTTKGDPVRVSEDVFSLGIGVFVENLYNKLHVSVFQKSKFRRQQNNSYRSGKTTLLYSKHILGLHFFK